MGSKQKGNPPFDGAARQDRIPDQNTGRVTIFVASTRSGAGYIDRERFSAGSAIERYLDRSLKGTGGFSVLPQIIDSFPRFISFPSFVGISLA